MAVRCLSLALLCVAVPAWADEVPPKPADLPVLPAKRAPASLAELKSLQEQVQKTIKKVLPATVGLMVGGAAGSGVIVSEDGYILTAGHVSGEAGKDVTVILSDGRRVKGKTLGANKLIDSGMIKITDAGPWPAADLGESKPLAKGQWVIALGHPNGYVTGRPPVVRLGRIGTNGDTLIQTDCTLVGGDSGGPLFDLDGKVIGIHSRISFLITQNIHVPVETYRATWDRLVSSEVWGGPSRRGKVDFADLGMKVKVVENEIFMGDIESGSAAKRAGLRFGDKIIACDGQTVSTSSDLLTLIRVKDKGETARLEIEREELKMTLRLVIPK